MFDDILESIDEAFGTEDELGFEEFTDLEESQVEKWDTGIGKWNTKECWTTFKWFS